MSTPTSKPVMSLYQRRLMLTELLDSVNEEIRGMPAPLAAAPPPAPATSDNRPAGPKPVLVGAPSTFGVPHINEVTEPQRRGS